MNKSSSGQVFSVQTRPTPLCRSPRPPRPHLPSSRLMSMASLQTLSLRISPATEAAAGMPPSDRQCRLKTRDPPRASTKVTPLLMIDLTPRPRGRPRGVGCRLDRYMPVFLPLLPRYRLGGVIPSNFNAISIGPRQRLCCSPNRCRAEKMKMRTRTRMRILWLWRC